VRTHINYRIKQQSERVRPGGGGVWLDCARRGHKWRCPGRWVRRSRVQTAYQPDLGDARTHTLLICARVFWGRENKRAKKINNRVNYAGGLSAGAPSRTRKKINGRLRCDWLPYWTWCGRALRGLLILQDRMRLATGRLVM
jgi:hypothetical protein